MKTFCILYMHCISLIVLLDIYESELIGVIQVNRHGARVGNNFEDESSYLFFGTSKAQLTVNGYKQHEALGHWIAERYIHYDYKLLNKEYDSKEIIFMSSPSERTIFSGLGFIKGLFPHSKITPVFKKNEIDEIKMKTDDVPPIDGFSLRLNRPEISLIVENPDKDFIFHSSSCRVNSGDETLSDLLYERKLYNITQQEITEVIDEIKLKWSEPFLNKTNDEIYTLKTLKYLNAYIRPTEYHFDNKYFNFSKKVNSLLNKIQIQKWYGKRIDDSPALKTMISGLYSDFINYLDHFNKLEKLKYVVYSGHDGTLIGIFANLFNREKLQKMVESVDEHYNFLQPGFASHFIIELHSTNLHGFLKNNTLKFVRVIYNGKVLRDVFDPLIRYNKQIDGIELEHFKNFLNTRIDPNYQNLKCERSGEDDALSIVTELQ